MKKVQILNKKAIKKILALIKQQWNADINSDYVFLQDPEKKIFIINKEFAKIDLKNLKINSFGLYFAQIMLDGLRLSIGGSQIIGPKAKKNILEINKKQMQEWFLGENLNIKTDLTNYVLIKHSKDFIGTGKVKENKILNYVPKSRRLNVI